MGFFTLRAIPGRAQRCGDFTLGKSGNQFGGSSRIGSVRDPYRGENAWDCGPHADRGREIHASDLGGDSFCLKETANKMCFCKMETLENLEHWHLKEGGGCRMMLCGPACTKGRSGGE